jgi:hypothetical protein
MARNNKLELKGNNREELLKEMTGELLEGWVIASEGGSFRGWQEGKVWVLWPVCPFLGRGK